MTIASAYAIYQQIRNTVSSKREKEGKKTLTRNDEKN